MPQVLAASLCQPFQITPVSSETMSPSRITRFFEGMPWTISSFTETQTLAG